MPMESLRRGLEPTLRSTWSSVPVLVLEGGRAVGKTTLCRQLRESGLIQEIVDLTDQATLEAAQHDPAGFVAGLRLPVAIDEAQLAENLTLAVKQRVDQLGSPGLFLLSGSTRLGRGALGGSDPLAGRAARLRLHSFTIGERRGLPVDLLPALHRGAFPEHRFAPNDEIVRDILVGGLPTIPGVVTPGGSPNVRRDLLGSYVESVVHMAVGESRSDRTRVLETFRAIASTPALILNLETLARDLGISSPTLRGYLQLLEASFLIEQIPAMANDARREIKGHPRLIPSDTALAAWAGRHSADTLRSNPTALGPLVHALVAVELCAQASWSERARMLHWRRRDDEVDTVLQFPDGALVGIEIKAAKSVSHADAAGLRSFFNRVSEARHGVIFYLGERAFELEAGVWAIPVQALWNPSFADASSTPTEVISSSPPVGQLSTKPNSQEALGSENAASDAAVFVSYVHADDQAEGGRIVALARDIGERYRLLTGEEIQTFIDKDDLGWGDEWRIRLDQQLARTTFFVPIVTPRFMRSEACRGEVLTFVAEADSAGVGAFVLPILYIRPAILDERDPVAAILTAHQWVDWTATRYTDVGSGEYRREVDRLCERLAQAVTELTHTARVTSTLGAQGTSSDDDDLRVRFERLESSAERLPESLERFGRTFAEVGQALTAATADTRSAQMPASPRHLRATLRRLAEQLALPISALDQATADLRSELKAFDTDLTTLLRLASSDPGAAQLLGRGLGNVRDSLPDGLGLNPMEVQSIRDQVHVLGRAARELRGPTRSLEDAFLLISDVDTMLRRWREHVDPTQT